jgi:predicted amidohydrolase YtcJ
MKAPFELVSVLLVSAALPFMARADDGPAELILEHGEIYSSAGWAEAIAIRRGVIIAVGNEAAVAPLRSAQTRSIDLEGAAVLPGLHDSHVHPLSAGQTELGCKFAQGTPAPQLLAIVKKCTASRAKGEWILGGQWDASSFGAEPPHRRLLDAVAPDNPVVLTDISLHTLWLNSKALQLSGITARTPDPDGGVIERDSTGEPTGIVRETARVIVRRAIPPYTAEQNAKALSWSLARMLSYGITSLTDATVDEAGLQAYATLADRGLLKQRITACMISGAMATQGTDFIARRNLYARERFAPTCIKMYLDGVPTEGHTAAMVEPYQQAAESHDPAGNGILIVPQEQLNREVIRLDAEGFTLKFHAAGDGAVRIALNAIEAARKANGFSGQLHAVAHNSFVQMSDIRRARGLAATFEFSPYIWSPNPIIPDIVKAVGAERMKRWIPVKDALDAGALSVAGSDWAVVPSVDPWAAIETLVTRQKVGAGGEILAADERITLQQALDLFTTNAARQERARTRLGSLERGMLADLIVLDRNPLRIPVSQVHETKVKLALIEGEIVYRAPN